MKLPIIGFLTAINSKRDIHGNRYWAFTYKDAKTGKVIAAIISGGESNIKSLRSYMSEDGEFIPASDSQIGFESYELPIRQFNRETKGYPYAGSTPQELATHIKGALKE